MRVDAEVKLIMQTQTELRAKLQTCIAAGNWLRAELDAAKQFMEVSQMLLMLFCLHENPVMSVIPYTSLALPTCRSCMTQSDLLTEKRQTV